MVLSLDVDITKRTESISEVGALFGLLDSAKDDQFRIDRFHAAVLKGFDDINRGACVTLQSPEEVDACIDRLWSDALRGLPDLDPDA